MPRSKRCPRPSSKGPFLATGPPHAAGASRGRRRTAASTSAAAPASNRRKPAAAGPAPRAAECRRPARPPPPPLLPLTRAGRSGTRGWRRYRGGRASRACTRWRTRPGSGPPGGSGEARRLVSIHGIQGRVRVACRSRVLCVWWQCGAFGVCVCGVPTSQDVARQQSAACAAVRSLQC